MILPAIAVNDRDMTLDRAWQLWRGNRIRFLLLLTFSYAIFAGLWFGVTWVGTNFGNHLFDLFEINTDNISSFGIDFWLFILAFNVVIPFQVFVLFFAIAATAGTLSLSYASMVRHALKVDRDYQPPKAVRDRLSV